MPIPAETLLNNYLNLAVRSGATDRVVKAARKNRQVDINSVYFSGWRSKVCLHPAQQK